MLPGFDVTSTTVSGILVRIKSSVFLDAGRVISLQCCLRPCSFVAHRKDEQSGLCHLCRPEFVSLLGLDITVSVCQSIQLRLRSPDRM